jgi:hypothetical protein
MDRPGILIFLLLVAGTMHAQRQVKGRVINAGGEPIANCNVFINHTSKGTTTDKSGRFELNDLPAGRHEIVISSVGYETVLIPYTEDKLPLTTEVSLQIKVKELENVTVEPFEEGNWLRWGFVFFENFIGASENALQCRILNKDSIHFRYYTKSKRLVAYADQPLLIENKSLGYFITYQMEQFELNFSNGSLFFMGYPHVNELNGKSSEVTAKLKRKRLKAYKGSIMHFMRSLYAGRLSEEGFDLRLVRKYVNLEKERVKKLYSGKPLHAIRGNIEYINEPKGLPKDSIKYYREVVQQPDILEEFGKDLLTADSLLEDSDTGAKILFFTPELFVTYKNEMEDEAYVRYSFKNRRPSHQRSYFVLLNGNALEIEANGNYFDQIDFLASGYWAWSEKMGDYLPLDYEPEKER